MNETDKTTTELSSSDRLKRSYQTRMLHVAALIAQGYTLPAIAKHPGLPSVATLRQLLVENANLRDAYDKARDRRNELLADDAVALADTLADANNAGLKLRIDARKWRAGLNRKDGKEKADKYGLPPDLAERIQRANERAEKHRLEQEKRFRAQVAVELSQRHGFAIDQETIDAAKIDLDFTYKKERDGNGDGGGE